MAVRFSAPYHNFAYESHYCNNVFFVLVVCTLSKVLVMAHKIYQTIKYW